MTRSGYLFVTPDLIRGLGICSLFQRDRSQCYAFVLGSNNLSRPRFQTKSCGGAMLGDVGQLGLGACELGKAVRTFSLHQGQQGFTHHG
jgi:hypothetical protein